MQYFHSVVATDTARSMTTPPRTVARGNGEKGSNMGMLMVTPPHEEQEEDWEVDSSFVGRGVGRLMGCWVEEFGMAEGGRWVSVGAVNL